MIAKRKNNTKKNKNNIRKTKKQIGGTLNYPQPTYGLQTTKIKLSPKELFAKRFGIKSTNKNIENYLTKQRNIFIRDKQKPNPILKPRPHM